MRSRITAVSFFYGFLWETLEIPEVPVQNIYIYNNSSYIFIDKHLHLSYTVLANKSNERIYL